MNIQEGTRRAALVAGIVCSMVGLMISGGESDNSRLITVFGGFLLPWSLIRALGWVLAGFRKQS